MAWSAYLSDLMGKHLFLTGTPQQSPMYLKNTYAGLAQASTSEDVYTEINKGGYARVPTTLSLYIDPVSQLCQLVTEADIQFAEATEAWTDIAETIIYDHPDKGYGNQIFVIPNYSESYGPEIAPYTVPIGSAVHFPWGSPGTRITIRQRTVMNETLPNWGGVSVEYSQEILRWIMNMSLFPYATTYDIAIGRDVEPEFWGRFSGIWSECQASDYERLSVDASFWEATSLYNIQNVSELVFTGSAQSDWGRITDIVLYAHNTNTAAFWAHLNTPTTVYTGDPFSIAAGKIVITFTGME